MTTCKLGVRTLPLRLPTESEIRFETVSVFACSLANSGSRVSFFIFPGIQSVNWKCKCVFTFRVASQVAYDCVYLGFVVRFLRGRYRIKIMVSDIEWIDEKG
jgi:hypothetical protein